MKKEKRYVKTIIVFIVIFMIILLLDKQIFLFIQSLRNPVLDTFFSWLLFIEKNFIFYSLIVVVAIVLLSWKKKDIIPFIISIVISMCLVFLFKTIVSRQRPLFNLKNSFPSGHATAALTPVPFLEYKLYKNITTIWIVVACFFVFARVWFGFHYLGDVIAGSFIGYGIAFIIKNCWKKLKISKNRRKKKRKKKR